MDSLPNTVDRVLGQEPQTSPNQQALPEPVLRCTARHTGLHWDVSVRAICIGLLKGWIF